MGAWKIQRNGGSAPDDACESGMSLVVDFGGRGVAYSVEWNSRAVAIVPITPHVAVVL